MCNFSDQRLGADARILIGKSKGIEAYLKLKQTSLMELFCENSQRLLAIDYFCRNAPP